MSIVQVPINDHRLRRMEHNQIINKCKRVLNMKFLVGQQ